MVKPKRVEDYGTDPDKLWGDVPDRVESKDDDDEDFAFIYRSGLAVPPDSDYYDAWCAWLKANHPDAEEVQKGKGLGGILKND